MGLFSKGKTCIIAKFQKTDLVICSHSRQGKTPSYSQINTVVLPLTWMSSGQSEKLFEAARVCFETSPSDTSRVLAKMGLR